MLICVFIVECSPKTHDTAFVEGTDLEGADVTIGIAAKDGTMRSRHGDNISFLFDNDILQGDRELLSSLVVDQNNMGSILMATRGISAL